MEVKLTTQGDLKLKWMNLKLAKQLGSQIFTGLPYYDSHGLKHTGHDYSLLPHPDKNNISDFERTSLLERMIPAISCVTEFTNITIVLSGWY